MAIPFSSGAVVLVLVTMKWAALSCAVAVNGKYDKKFALGLKVPTYLD
jgi:hypothetical protein